MTGTLQQTYSEMHYELAMNQLEVMLIPAPEPRHCSHFIRAAVHANPHWYQALCRRYQANRSRPRRTDKHDTRIKRRYILEILERLANGESGFTKYEEPLKEIARDLATNYANEPELIEGTG